MAPMCRVFGSDLNLSTLSYLSGGFCAASLLILPGILSLKLGEHQGWAQGLGGVCMCVHFSLLNPKPNMIDFWNHCLCLFSPSVQIIES